MRSLNRKVLAERVGYATLVAGLIFTLFMAHATYDRVVESPLVWGVGVLATYICTVGISALCRRMVLDW